jgi:hypothetical protein
MKRQPPSLTGVVLTLSGFAPGWLVGSGEPAAPESIRSSPPDMTPYARPAVPEDTIPLGREAIVTPPTPFDIRIVDTVVRNTDPILTEFEDPPAVAQKTNHNVPRSFGIADQPWLLVNRDSKVKHQDNVYIAYDDFSGAPDMRVAVAPDTGSLDLTLDSLVGVSTGFVNPVHRLAVDPHTGAVYSLFQRRIAAGAGGSQNINHMLNRSTDGGRTWSLNGSSTGIIVANADSTQPTPKFCTVNALLGGVLHAAADPPTAGTSSTSMGTATPPPAITALPSAGS